MNYHKRILNFVIPTLLFLFSIFLFQSLDFVQVDLVSADYIEAEQLADEPILIENDIVIYSTQVPDEIDLNEDTYNWTGKGRDPKKIIIPILGIDNFIQKVGIDQNNEIAVPTNVNLAGWFVETVRPGEKGLSIIDGHVDGREFGGVFFNLERLTTGDRFSVVLGDSTELTYEVLEVTTVPIAQSFSKLFSQNPTVESQLNLITCGGEWDSNIGEYMSRTIVSSKLVF